MTTDTTTRMGDNDAHHAESGNLISAERVQGTAVYDSTGERIGSIDSVILTKDSGRVAYAIMSFGGFLGIGERYHPLPWHTLDYDTDLNGYRLATSGAQLKDAPNYDRAALEQLETGAGSWREATDTYYGKAGMSAAQVTTTSDRRPYRA